MFDTLIAKSRSYAQSHPGTTQALKGVWAVLVTASAVTTCYKIAETVNVNRTPESE